jgi:hypothetical protein
MMEHKNNDMNINKYLSRCLTFGQKHKRAYNKKMAEDNLFQNFLARKSKVGVISS